MSTRLGWYSARARLTEHVVPQAPAAPYSQKAECGKLDKPIMGSSSSKPGPLTGGAVTDRLCLPDFKTR